MNHCVRIAWVASVLVSWMFFDALSICAQPLGLMSQQPQREPHHECLSSPNGRFVFGQISDSTKDQFMLDTFTGRLWRIGESGKIGLFLEPVPYRTPEGECSNLPEDVVKGVTEKHDPQ